MRRMFDSMFEEVEVDIKPSQEESVATFLHQVQEEVQEEVHCCLLKKEH